ncbi:MAG: transcription antitermination factor NusB [Myxococcales bacterium]|nr:transcription antitermination factor NusB [Myxococcales bacterium]
MMLYGMDVTRAESTQAIAFFFDNFGSGRPIDPPQSWDRGQAYRVRLDLDRQGEARTFAEMLVVGVGHRRLDLDAAIQKVSTKWRLERMAILDRNVLRLATFELLYCAPDVPRKVVLNEAVELAKMFGTSESGAFVNGVLDRIASADT